ncbi:phage tail tip fiber protein [Pseudomonas sivasensis]|uniref:DUF1983 domain-containing protein n=1 Tax=Pseudomonas sivasensis TaxID=1880678 RepID=A0ABW8E554_9PSED
MSGSIQSSDYVPGVSGWKFNEASGEFEIHSSSGNSSADAQLVSVTAGSWSDHDLPANALERLAFIGAEMERIPAEYRANAELTTEDISLDRDGSDVRISLTYDRQETPEEVEARCKQSSIFGMVNRLGGANLNIYQDGKLRARLGKLVDPDPFIVADGKVYMRQDVVDKACVASPWPAAWGVKMKLSADGKYVAAGFGLGIETSADFMPDIIVKASHMEVLPDGLVKITQAPKKA